ncbi:MAG: hypothetical protein DRN19_04525, partial [Thermoplasmata archaeon]
IQDILRKVEKLRKSGHSFEFRAPTAVTGVRGENIRDNLFKNYPDIFNDSKEVSPFIIILNDTIYKVFQKRMNESNTQIIFEVSVDEGENWTTVYLKPSYVNSSSLWPRISGDNNGTVFVVWQDNRNGFYDIYGALSYDYGKNWTQNILIHSSASNSTDATPCIDENGMFHVVWQEEIGNISEIIYSNSSDGTNWSLPVNISKSFARSVYPAVKCGNNTLHVVWADNRTGNFEIFYSNSTDGVTWTEPLQISHSSVDAGEPDISVTSENDIFVSWRDSRHGGSEIYLNHSMNGSWMNEYRITDDKYYSEYPNIILLANYLIIYWHDNRSVLDEVLCWETNISSSNWLKNGDINRVERDTFNVLDTYFIMNFNTSAKSDLLRFFRAYNIYAYLNGYEIGILNNTVAYGTYLFPLNSSVIVNTTNNTNFYEILTEYMNQGNLHIVYNFTLMYRLDHITIPIFARNLTEGDQKVMEIYNEIYWAKPDLTTFTNYISTKTQRPVAGDNVSINVTIFNFGEKIAKNVTVDFYINYPNNESFKIGDTIIIPSLLPFHNCTISPTENWTAEKGIHKLFVVIDKNDTVDEYNEKDNQAFILFIPYSKTPPTGNITINSGKETTSSRICTIEFQIESDNEISYYRLSNDNITWSDWIDYSQYVMWLLSEGYGMKTVYAQVMDEIGLISPVFTDDIELVFIDENPPTTTVRRGNPSYDNYITSSTPIWFDAVDDYSGVNKTYYRIWYNGVWSAWTIYVENFSLDEECKHYIEFYSSDNSENNEAIKNITLYVDNTPPSHNIDVGVPSYTDGINQWINFSTPVYINASDEGPCKVGSYHIHWIIWNSTGGYAYNSNITNTANIILYINEECKHIIGYWVEDNLGNRDPAIGYINTTVYVDNSEPDTIMETGSLSYQYNRT